MQDFHNFNFEADGRFKDFIAKFEVPDPNFERKLRAKFYKVGTSVSNAH